MRMFKLDSGPMEFSCNRCRFEGKPSKSRKLKGGKTHYYCRQCRNVIIVKEKNSIRLKLINCGIVF